MVDNNVTILPLRGTYETSVICLSKANNDDFSARSLARVSSLGMSGLFWQIVLTSVVFFQ